MEHDTVDGLRRHHSAWALLRADNAALVISFLDRVFIEGSARAVARGQLVELLDDHLFALRERLGPEAYPRSAADYLDSWAGSDGGWLRSSDPADGPFSDVTVRLDELAARPLAARDVLVVENEVTFLALPLLEGVAVLLSGGYAVGKLSALPWLADRRLLYWGDLDTHGLAQLDGLRAHLPHARSVLMDVATLLAHREHWGVESTPTRRRPERLTPDELALYEELGAGVHGDRLRLEQERVRFSYASHRLERALRSGC